MTGGTVMMKCTRCKMVYKDVHVPDYYRVLYYFSFGVPLPKEWFNVSSLSKKGIHQCNPKEYGISHVIGVNEDDT